MDERVRRWVEQVKADILILKAAWNSDTSFDVQPPDVVKAAFIKPFYHWCRERDEAALKQASADREFHRSEEFYKSTRGKGPDAGAADANVVSSPLTSDAEKGAQQRVPPKDKKGRDLYDAGPCKTCGKPTQVPFRPKYETTVPWATCGACYKAGKR